MLPKDCRQNIKRNTLSTLLKVKNGVSFLKSKRAILPQKPIAKRNSDTIKKQTLNSHVFIISTEIT
jgi:hypothetical protein